MANSFLGIASGIANWLWGWPILICTSIVAVFMTAKLGFFQFRFFGHSFKETLGKIFDKGSGEGSINPFKATCTALASTLGVGNIAGVSVAIAAGGPGAIFWMWFIALIGLILKFAEITLAVTYREKDKESGDWIGGFPWYVKNGLGKNWRWLGVLWAITLAFCMMCAPSVQANSLVEAVNSYFTINPWIIGIALAILIMAVVLGGLKRVSEFANFVVPFMAIAYIIVAIYVIFINRAMVGHAFGMIFHDAFTGTAATGGFAGGTIMLAVRWGLARGIYSNEAGTGVAPLAHASASVNHPVKQGLWGIFEVFFDTIVVCTMTALVVLTSGLWNSGMTGAGLTTAAFSKAMGSEAAGSLFISIIIVFFAFTTCVVNVYYGGICLKSLGIKGKIVTVYSVIACLFAILGCVAETRLLWASFDIFYGICIICNLIVIPLLGTKILKLVKDYKQRLKTNEWEETSADTVAKLGIWDGKAES